jgi:small-conductance mechanosensitive channel
VLSRTPAERASAAAQTIRRLVAEASTISFVTHVVDGGVVFTIADQPMFAILPEDLDPLAGETLNQAGREAESRLRVALAESVELHDARRLVTAVGRALAMTGLWLGLLWGLRRLYVRGTDWLTRAAARRLARLPGGAIIGAANASAYVIWLYMVAVVSLGLLLTYGWMTFTLRQFPYTRPLGESLRSRMFTVLGSLIGEFVAALPNILTVAAILIVTRIATRIVTLVFDAAEHGRITIPWVYRETAQPTRRISVALLWLCGLIVAYRYMPGSDSDAFKGVSIFVGLMVSLGSTGIMNQVMSGLTMTYSRALKKGDFVRIGEVEGTVTHLGALSAKIKTIRNEEITIPNAVVVSHATTNYSQLNETEGVRTSTSVTIGYDVPWRQVHALLLLAAERTAGLQTQHKPVVRQTALQDFYVQYTLLVCLDQPQNRPRILDALHANIQDTFNEFGVQIMSPNYEADPEGPKVVPKEHWYAAPAVSPVPGQAPERG